MHGHIVVGEDHMAASADHGDKRQERFVPLIDERLCCRLFRRTNRLLFRRQQFDHGIRKRMSGPVQHSDFGWRRQGGPRNEKQPGNNPEGQFSGHATKN